MTLLVALSAVTVTTTAAQTIGYKIDGPYDKRQSKSLFKEMVRRDVDPATDPAYFSIAREVTLRCLPATGFLATEQEKLRPATLRIAEGTHAAFYKILNKSTGKAYFLLPVAERKPNLAPYSNTASGTRNHALYIGIDPERGVLLSREILMYDKQYQLLDGSWGAWHDNEWTSGCDLDPASTSGDVLISVLTSQQYEDRIRAGLRAASIARSQEEARRQSEAERTRPLKTQIGAGICKLQRGVLFEGFTEAKSPDNNKIQIRIVRASFSSDGQPSPVSPAGFKEQIIWDDPDLWQMCQ